MPEGDYGQTVEEHKFHLEQWQVCPQRRGPSEQQQYRRAEEQHHQMEDYGDGENEERQNYDRNAGLGEHSRKIGNGHRLPEQDAAIATLAVQRVERVEDTDDEGGRVEPPGKWAVRHGYHEDLMGGGHGLYGRQG